MEKEDKVEEKNMREGGERVIKQEKENAKRRNREKRNSKKRGRLQNEHSIT